MVWTIPKTWVVSDVLRASDANIHLAQNLDHLGERTWNRPGCSAFYSAAALPISANVLSFMAFPSARYNVGGMWSSGQNDRFITWLPGRYTMGAQLIWAGGGAATDDVRVDVYVNDVLVGNSIETNPPGANFGQTFDIDEYCPTNSIVKFAIKSIIARAAFGVFGSVGAEAWIGYDGD